MTARNGQDRAFALYGTDRCEAQPVRLTAGRLTVDLAGGQLRSVRYDGVEVLRGVAFLVRDRDWGTYDPDIDNLVVEQRADGFSVSYTATCRGPGNSDLLLLVTISADAGGPLVFNAEAVSGSGFETCRCGFCILHPIVGLAGQPVAVTHVDGNVETSVFPDLIEPLQPFKDIRAIAHEAMPGVTAECRMEGDTFEMEDQRNWSDASYKTYVRPLALPWPYTIGANEPVRQRVVLTITDSRKALPAPIASSAGPDLIRLTPGTRSGRMPAIGLVVTPEEAAATFAAGAKLNELGVQELLFHFDPLAGHDGRALVDFAAIAALHQGTTTLELALPCRAAVTTELTAITALARAAGFAPDALVVSPAVDRQSTPPGSAWPDCPPLEDLYRAARDAFAGCRLGGGMLSYFTELNRKRVPPEQLDFITHCTNPIVHAADDRSVMQTLEALPFITRSVRSIYGDKPYRIGPSTIPMRQNPYGSRTMDNPAGGRIAMAHADPRHNADFAAAFALGYASRVAEANLECLTLSALTGPFGLVAGPGEPVAAGLLRPLYGVVKGLADLFDTRWTQCVSSAPDKVLAIAVERPDDSRLLWVANLTPRVLIVDVSAWSAWASSAVDRMELQPFGLGKLG